MTSWTISPLPYSPYPSFLLGLLTTLLSLLSAFGLLMLLGVPYNVINTIIPFLIIAVGIDDMFVMNACWAHSDPSLPVSERMAQMMRDGGVAVSITNV
jgi:predicted RND superfamily exporter protein